MIIYDVKVPKAFWDDHVKRGCVENNYRIRELSKHYVVGLTARDLADLLSDAHHYATSAANYGWDMQWLVSSARATKQAIIKQIGYSHLNWLWERYDLCISTGRELGLTVERAS